MNFSNFSFFPKKAKRKLTVRALPKNLPDFLLADVSNLNLNDSITVLDLSEDTFKILHPETQVVCQVKMSRASMSIDDSVEDEDLEEGAEGTDATEGDKPSSEKSSDEEKKSDAKSSEKKDEGNS